MKWLAITALTTFACSSAPPPEKPAEPLEDPVAPPALAASPDLGADLEKSVRDRDFTAITALVNPARAVRLTVSCGEPSEITDAATVGKLLLDVSEGWESYIESAADYAGSDPGDVTDENGDPVEFFGVWCTGRCCTVRSGAPTMCEVCTASVELCVESGELASIAIADAAGVICDDGDEQL